jgi:hypothetical protein
MPTHHFASDAWLLKNLFVSVPGWLEWQHDRLRFTTPEKVIFDCPRAEVSVLTYPWYYFGGGVKLRAAGTKYTLSWVRPNGAEVASARLASSANPAAAALLVASKVTDIRSGRDAGRRWREILGEPAKATTPSMPS